MIPYSRQTIEEDDIQAVIKVLKSDWLTQGPAVREFEKVLAQYVGSKYAVAFSSGTAALQAAYYAIGIKKGDEIITSPLTFAATANAALWQGGKPVFVDIKKDGNIDPDLIEKKINKNTKAITAIDYAGMPADLDEIKKIAKKHKIIFIEDAAHSLGAEYKGKKVGSQADMTMFSFHPVKPITTGEGGVITTNSKEYFEKLILFRSHGITKNSSKFRHKSPGAWYHEMQILGQNYRLTDIQAALGISQLKKLSKFSKKRNQIVERYNKLLKNIPGLILPEIPKSSFKKSSWHLYPVRISTGNINKINRQEVFKKLQEAGIGVQVHYIPVYFHPYYEDLGYKKGLCPCAEEFYQTEISLPVFPTLSLKDQKYIVNTLISVLKK
jgi:perosamine synthetase